MARLSQRCIDRRKAAGVVANLECGNKIAETPSVAVTAGTNAD